MNDDTAALEKKVSDLSRGLFLNRCLLVFIAVCVGIILFFPRLAADLAAHGERFSQAVSPLLPGILGGLVAVIVIFSVLTYILAKVSPTKGEGKVDSTY